MNRQDILNAYAFRHACKAYDPAKKVSTDDFYTILEAGRLSPSSFGLEPAKFVVLKNPEILRHISENALGVGQKALDCSEFVLVFSRKGKTLQEDTPHFLKIMKQVKGMDESSYDGVASFFKAFRTRDFDLNDERAFDDWAARQTFIALGNMMTAAAMLGIDSSPMEGFNQAAMSSYLSGKGVFDCLEFNLVVMVAFGYRLHDPAYPQTRQDFDDVVTFIR